MKETIHFKHDKPLQGEFQEGSLNLILAFQVNCPGCFLYAIPVFNELFKKWQGQVNILGLSTAFEDFDLNTKDNTSKLLDSGQLVGETKKALAPRQLDPYPNPILFPVAMDYTMSDDERHTFAQSSPYVSTINSLPMVSYTFWNNYMRGTPSFYLFNSNREILGNWFGHVSADVISATIEEQTKQ